MKNGSLFSELPEWIPEEAWKGWLEMRRQKRIPMTDRAKQMAFNTLARLRDEGEEVEHILGQSEFHGWSGLFKVSDSYYQMLGIDRSKERQSALIVNLNDRRWAE